MFNACELREKGTKDATLHLSGIINNAEFLRRQCIIESKLNDAGIDLMEYVMAMKNN